MRQHPVPQHIASYEFRLVGDMTLRQFGMLAGCCIIALIFYASGIPGFFKWPLVLFFVILGVALAFVPIEERPLHEWIIAFFKAVYSPTQFIWRKRAQKLDIFEASPPKVVSLPTTAFPTPDKDQLARYLQTLPTKKGALEEEEEKSLRQINQLFEQVAPLAPATEPIVTPAPVVEPQPISPPTQPIPKPEPAPIPPPPPEPKPEPKLPQLEPRPTIKTEKPTVEPRVSSRLPFPQTPRSPNLLVGMVLDPQGKMIEGAIIEIRDSQGLPVRAFKTNKLGQFRIITPLKNGVYEIETEKEGYHFDIIKIDLKGEPVLPIEIRARPN